MKENNGIDTDTQTDRPRPREREREREIDEKIKRKMREVGERLRPSKKRPPTK